MRPVAAEAPWQPKVKGASRSMSQTPSEGFGGLQPGQNARADRTRRSFTGVARFVTTCFGPRTAAAGFTGRTWLTTSQSPSMRIAAKCCFTVGTDPGLGPDSPGDRRDRS